MRAGQACERNYIATKWFLYEPVTVISAWRMVASILHSLEVHTKTAFPAGRPTAFRQGDCAERVTMARFRDGFFRPECTFGAEALDRSGRSVQRERRCSRSGIGCGDLGKGEFLAAARA